MHPAPLAVREETVPDGARRDAPQWAVLIRVHQHRVVMALMASGHGLDRATELANEAWARLIERERAGQLDRIALPGLAIVQARFLAADERRREATRAAHRADAAASETLAIDGRPDPEQRLLGREQAARALREIATAPVSAQRLFRLLHADPAMSHADAAAALGLSVQRVRQLLCELRKRVRAAIEGEAP